MRPGLSHRDAPVKLQAWVWIPTPVDCFYAAMVTSAPAGYCLHVVPEAALKDPRARGSAWIAGQLGRA